MSYKNEWDEYKNVVINKGLTALRIKKLQVMYNTIQRHLNKGLKKLNKEDIRNYIEELNKGDKSIYTKKDGKPLSSSTISDIKKFLKQFFKWYKGEDNYYPDEVRWLSVKIPKDQKPNPKDTISIDEVKELASMFSKIEYRIMTLLLFDTGFRISEMKSVKKKDVTWEKYDDKDSCFWITCNESKTYTRKIPIPLFTPDLESYFNSSHYMGLKPNDLVFDMHYESMLKQLKKHSKKFSKVITFHSLRHSSATYWADQMEYLELCTRFGWSYSSKQASIYVRRSKKQHTKSVQKTFNNSVSELKDENKELKQELDSMRAEFQKQLEQQRKEFTKILMSMQKVERGKLTKDKHNEVKESLKKGDKKKAISIIENSK